MVRYQYANADNTVIKVTTDEGDEYWVSTDPANRHYAEILDQGIEPLPPEPPNPEEPSA